jgi:hypothetical protein
MTDENICGACTHYHAILVPTGKGNTRETRQGHCLARTIYAKNKPGNPVFPLGAKTADLPYARHAVVVVRKDQKMPNCTHYAKKGNSR